MNNRVLFLFIIALVSISCTAQKTFTILGTLSGGEYDGQKVYLQMLDSTWDTRELITVDTTTIANGKFTFKGIAGNRPAIHYIQLLNPPQFMSEPVFFALEPGTIKIDIDSIPVIGGTPVNKDYNKYAVAEAQFTKDIVALYDQLSKDKTNTQLREEVEKREWEGAIKIRKERVRFIKANIGNQVGAYTFIYYFGTFSPEEQNKFMAKINPEYKSIPEVQEKVNMLNAMN
ncbi:MAG: DUF4369 domain-containing protein [Prevotella sp.]|jgi:hypothetical protein|nr:DUF4369 domain-containing protein [Prevotella sp.]